MVGSRISSFQIVNDVNLVDYIYSGLQTPPISSGPQWISFSFISTLDVDTFELDMHYEIAAANPQSSCALSCFQRMQAHRFGNNARVIVTHILIFPKPFAIELTDELTDTQTVCISGQFNISNQYVLLVTDKSTFSEMIPIFQPSISLTTKILAFNKVELINSYSAKANLPPISSVNPGEFTMHVIELSNQGNFGTGFYTSRYIDFYSGESFDSYYPPNALPSTFPNHQSMVYSLVLTNPDSFSRIVSLQFTFIGIMLGVYVNNQFVGASSSMPSTYSTESIFFPPDTSLILTVFGYDLLILGLQATGLKSRYLSQLVGSQDFQYPNAFQARIPNCIMQLNDECYECESQKLLDGTGNECVEFCPPSFYPVKDKYCKESRSSLGLEISTAYSTYSNVAIDYRIAVYSNFSHIVRVYYPYPMLLTNFPGIQPSNTNNPSLGESVYIITPTPSSPNIETMQAVDNLGYSPVALDPIYFAVYGLVKNKYLYLENTNAGNAHASKIQLVDKGDLPSDVTPGQFFDVRFLLECNQPCSLRVIYSNILEITRNDRTVLFSDNASNKIDYTLVRKFTGVSLIRITGSHPEDFSFDITSSDYNMYSLRSFLYSNSFMPTHVEAGNGISNCNNRVNGACLSCNSGYFLSLSRKECLDSCSGGGTPYPKERICACTNSNECPSSNPICTFSLCNNCTQDEECIAQGDQKCINGDCITCPPDCIDCSSPSQCITCSTGFALEADLQCYKICQEGEFRVARNECLPICRKEYPYAAGGCYSCNSNDSYCSQLYPDQDTKKCNVNECIKCPDNCQYCLSGTQCINCWPGFNLNNGQCQKICNQGEANYNLTHCLPICKYELPFSSGQCGACTADSQCIGLYPQQETFACVGKECIKCPEDCLRCSSRMWCDTCRPGLILENGECFIQCPDGVQRISRVVCADVCGDGRRPITSFTGFCDDGNTIAGDGCDLFCAVEEGYYCIGGGPNSPDRCYLIPKIAFKQSTLDPNTLYLIFNRPYDALEELQNHLSIRLSLEDFIPEYNIKKVDDLTYSIEFNLPYSIPGQDIIIDFSNTTRIKTFMNDPKQILPIRGMKEGTLLKRVDSIKDLLQDLSTGGVVVVGATSVLCANPVAAWFLMNLIQQYYYLIFINVEYPINVEMILATFSIGRLPFIPDISSIIVGGIKESLPSPYKFQDNELDGMFLKNAGSMLTLWGCLLFVVITCKFLLVFSKYLPPHVVSFLQKTNDSLVWSGILGTWFAVYMDMNLCAMLQLRTISFQSFLTSLSSVLGIVAIIFNVIFPFLVYKLLSKLRKSRSKEDQNKYESLFSPYKFKPKVCYYFNLFLLIRRFAFPAALVLFYYNTVLQLVSIIIVHLIPTAISLKYAPYKDPKISFCIIIDEVVTLAIYVLIGWIHHVNNTPYVTETTKELIGWGIILCMSISCLTNIAFLIRSNIVLTIDAIKQLLKKPEGSAMVTINPTNHRSRLVHKNTVRPYVGTYSTFEDKTKLLRLKEP